MFLLTRVTTDDFPGLAGFHMKTEPTTQGCEMDSQFPLAYRTEKPLKGLH